MKAIGKCIQYRQDSHTIADEIHHFVVKELGFVTKLCEKTITSSLLEKVCDEFDKDSSLDFTCVIDIRAPQGYMVHLQKCTKDDLMALSDSLLHNISCDVPTYIVIERSAASNNMLMYVISAASCAARIDYARSDAHKRLLGD